MTLEWASDPHSMPGEFRIGPMSSPPPLTMEDLRPHLEAIARYRAELANLTSVEAPMSDFPMRDLYRNLTSVEDLQMTDKNLTFDNVKPGDWVRVKHTPRPGRSLVDYTVMSGEVASMRDAKLELRGSRFGGYSVHSLELLEHEPKVQRGWHEVRYRNSTGRVVRAAWWEPCDGWMTTPAGDPLLGDMASVHFLGAGSFA